MVGEENLKHRNVHISLKIKGTNNTSTSIRSQKNPILCCIFFVLRWFFCPIHPPPPKQRVQFYTLAYRYEYQVENLQWPVHFTYEPITGFYMSSLSLTFFNILTIQCLHWHYVLWQLFSNLHLSEIVCANLHPSFWNGQVKPLLKEWNFLNYKCTLMRSETPIR